MKVVSLFAGIGGFDLALQRAGHEIVYVNEWDKYAAQTYEKNFCNCFNRNTDGGEQENKTGNDEGGQGLESEKGQVPEVEKRLYEQHNNSRAKQRTFHHVDTRSITDVPTSDIPNHDLLVGGFPCQSFSIAGKRKGFSDTRGTLFFEIARILQDKRPSFFILENVKGLLSHDKGNTFTTIITTLDELGYDTQWQVLNSKNFGVPQNRERVFIVGHLRGKPRLQIFPIGGDNEQSAQKLGSEIAYTLNASYYKGINTGSQGGKSSFDKMKRQMVFDRLKIRRLTPIECERLQGFPDNWTKGVSDTQRYKQLGNAVTVNVVEEILKRFDLNLTP